MIMANPAVTPFKDTIDLRREVIAACFYMRDRLGYFVGTWGNISVRIEDGLLVTPSRVKYEEVQPDDLVVVGWEGGVVRGHRVPTSETELHRQLMLERPDLGAIIHSHSPWASVCACAHRSIPVLSDDMAEVIGGEVRCARYAPAGRHRELAQAVREAIGPDACAVLLGNHGVAAGGRDLAEAIVSSQFVEKAAMILLQAQAIGGVKPIPDELWREERHRYLYKYGKPEDVAEILKRPGDTQTR
jgi:L-fuculose-phosphate aldolase